MKAPDSDRKGILHCAGTVCAMWSPLSWWGILFFNVCEWTYWAWHHFEVLAHFSFAESFKALKLAQYSKSYIKGTRVHWIWLESRNFVSFNGVLKSWGDLWIPPGGAFRCCCEVWSQSYSAATKLCIHKLWCLETRQGIEIIKVVMLSKQNLSMYHQLESCNKEGKKKVYSASTYQGEFSLFVHYYILKT